MTLSVRNMDGERGAVLTQSAKVWTHRVRRPPFWLVVTALDRNRYLPVYGAPWGWVLGAVLGAVEGVVWGAVGVGAGSRGGPS